MFTQVPIQKRWRIILGIIAFAFLVSFAYAAQVWGIYAKIDELQAKTEVIEDADMEIVNRQVQLKQLSDNIRGVQSRDSLVGTHVQLMQYIEQQCDQNRLRLIQLPKENIQEIEGYQIAAIDFSLPSYIRWNQKTKSAPLPVPTSSSKPFAPTPIVSPCSSGPFASIASFNRRNH
jgi:hypothetical protein